MKSTNTVVVGVAAVAALLALGACSEATTEQAMITHHQGAIDMAQNEAKNGQYQAAVEMAKSIITSQQKEIDTMKSVLSSL